jgi:hypothetical protein
MTTTNTKPIPQTITADATLDVKARLAQLAQWQQEWAEEDVRLSARVNQLRPDRQADIQRAMQIASFRRRLRMKLVQEPLEIEPEVVRAVGYQALRQSLIEQFGRLSKAERLLWLNNFLFIVTPDLRRLNDKIIQVRSYRSLGQQRNFMLGGPSGMGKTTYLDWYASNYLPQVTAECNYVPIVKIDAPVSNHTPKPLFQRMILECGLLVAERDNEEDLLMKLALCFQQCQVELLIVDEIEHITKPRLRRRLLEVSNLTHGVPMICASCHPLRWAEGDAEVQGRWNDSFELKQYTGERLQQLLAFIELLLPFTQDSALAMVEVKRRRKRQNEIDSLAQLIEQWTGGILRDIMILIVEASARAIEQNLPGLSPSLLTATWQSIQTCRVTDFLAVLKRREGEL